MNKPRMTQLEIISEIRKGTECTLDRARDLSVLLNRCGVLSWRQPFQAEEGDALALDQPGDVVIHSHPELEGLLERIASALEVEQNELIAVETGVPESEQELDEAQKAS